MEDFKDMITLIRYKDKIVCHYDTDAFKDEYERLEYHTGDMSKEDAESSYIGALKYFFNESEVWNE